MKINNLDQVFNLYDTNGRRNDVINAYNIYTNILEEIYDESDSNVWATYPNSNTQFRFYELAIKNSPEVFNRHPKYDEFIEAMKNPIINEAFKERDINKLKSDPTLNDLYITLDVAIEKRARHYSSNLVKIGLANEKRQVSPIGKSWIHGKKLKRSRFEKLLPIDDTNLIFLRQLLKLRIYTKDETYYYSPMLMAIYILIENERVSQDLFITIVQMLNPYFPVDPAYFINEFLGGNAQNLEREYILFDSHDEYEEVINEPTPIPDKDFSKYFYSGKTKDSIEIYKTFYKSLVKFNNNRTRDNLEEVFDLFLNKRTKNILNKAFGFGRNIFDFNEIEVIKFMQNNEDSELLNNEDLNKKLYLQFQASKRHDLIQEYGDVTRRVMKVTGIISFKNGIVELKHRDIFESFFNKLDLENIIFGASTPEGYKNYEKKATSSFLNHLTLEEILVYDNEKIEETIYEIRNELKLGSESEVKEALVNKTSMEFIKHIHEHYPKEKTLEILNLFSDRSNDLKIKKMVAEDTDIPTIFEFIVGITWYYISSEKFDLFSSLNLSMSADFEPEAHAGGGVGDIIIEYNDYILMLEVTLMNKYAQKRGEWEPVLRHATNLTIESAPKKVTTLFIADELDQNTINIWRAVAMVPLESSRSREEFAKNVTIMPLKNEELASMLESEVDDKLFIKNINDSFEKLSTNFNRVWRKEILKDINELEN